MTCSRRFKVERDMKPTLFVVTTALVAMPWLAGAQDAGRRPTANNPAIAPDQLRPLGSRLAQAGPQPPDPDSATRRVRTIILRSDARTKDEPPQSDRPQAEGLHNERRAEIPSSRPPSQFRQIYFCDQKDPASACALGEITGWKTVTVVGPGGKSVERSSGQGDPSRGNVFGGHLSRHPP